MEAEDYQFEQDSQHRRSNKPRFDGTINLGHVLTMIMMGTALLTMWTNTKVTEAEHNSRITVLEHSQVEMHDTMKTLADSASASQRTQDKLSLTLEYLAKQIGQKP